MPYIISNEAAERFSFYGMKGILVIFMTQYLFLTSGETNISEESAKGYFHLFTAAVYLFHGLSQLTNVERDLQPLLFLNCGIYCSSTVHSKHQ